MMENEIKNFIKDADKVKLSASEKVASSKVVTSFVKANPAPLTPGLSGGETLGLSGSGMKLLMAVVVGLVTIGAVGGYIVRPNSDQEVPVIDESTLPVDAGDGLEGNGEHGSDLPGTSVNGGDNIGGATGTTSETAGQGQETSGGDNSDASTVEPNQEVSEAEVEVYLSCPCGCCDESEAKEVCLDKNEGESIDAIIARDQDLKTSLECSEAKCGQGTIYTYCDQNPESSSVTPN